VFPMPQLMGPPAPDASRLLGQGSEAASAEDQEDSGGAVELALTSDVTAQLSYAHTFMFETAANDELRNHRFGSFSTDRERDVFGLLMDWSLGQSAIGIGYQLESTRAAPQPGRGLGALLPSSTGIGVTSTLPPQISSAWRRQSWVSVVEVTPIGLTTTR